MEGAFESAVARHQAKIYTFACYFLGDRAEAEDVTQEVLIRLWRNLAKLDAARMAAWLVRVTRNACYDRLRQKRATGRYLAPELDGEAAERVPSQDPDPEATATRGDLRRRLTAALTALDEPYRSVLILREVQGLSYQEISDALEVPLNTVRVHIHRGRQRLRQALHSEPREVTVHA